MDILAFDAMDTANATSAPHSKTGPSNNNVIMFSHIYAVALMLASLPTRFHSPLYERALALLKQNPLLAPEPMDELPPADGPFSCFCFTDYSANLSSMLDNLPNRVLCLLQNFFLQSDMEDLAILPNFIRALAPVSMQQMFFACKLVAPFIYRMNLKPELSLEIIFELHKSLVVVLARSSTGTLLGSPDPLDYVDTIIDFLNHAVAIFRGPTDTLKPIMEQIAVLRSTRGQ